MSITEFNTKFWQGYIQIDHRKNYFQMDLLGIFVIKDAEAYVQLQYKNLLKA